MHKSKILSRKFIIGLAVIFTAVLLIPFSIQAFADNTNEDCSINWGEAGSDGDLILSAEVPTKVSPGTTLTTNTDKGVSYISMEINGVDTVIASAYPSDWYEFDTWQVDTELVSNETSSIIVNTDVTITPKFKIFDVSKGFGAFHGRVYTGSFFFRSPLPGVEVTFVYRDSMETYLTAYTDLNGYYRLYVPFNVYGSLHALKAGYVSDYSQNMVLTTTDPVLRVDDTLETGCPTNIKSNNPNLSFHFMEYINISGALDARERTENVYLPEIPNRQLANGAYFTLLANDTCDQYGLNHGTLLYDYREGGLGGRYFEISIQPADNFPFVKEWTYKVDGNTITFIPGESVEVNWTNVCDITCNYQESVKPDEVVANDGFSKLVATYYNGGDVVSGPNDIKLDDLTFFKDGQLYVDKDNKLHCEYTSEVSNDFDSAIVVEAVGLENYAIDNWTANDDVLTSEPITSTDVNKIGVNFKYVDPNHTAQTGDDNLAIVIALIVVICACGGFIAYKKIRKK